MEGRAYCRWRYGTGGMAYWRRFSAPQNSCPVDQAAGGYPVFAVRSRHFVLFAEFFIGRAQLSADGGLSVLCFRPKLFQNKRKRAVFGRNKHFIDVAGIVRPDRKNLTAPTVFQSQRFISRDTVHRDLLSVRHRTVGHSEAEP